MVFSLRDRRARLLHLRVLLSIVDMVRQVNSLQAFKRYRYDFKQAQNAASVRTARLSRMKQPGASLEQVRLKQAEAYRLKARDLIPVREPGADAPDRQNSLPKK